MITKNSFFRFIRLCFILFLLISTIFLIRISIIYIYPILFAFLFSRLLHPIVTLLQNRWKINRGLATFICIGLCFTIIIVLLIALFKRLYTELDDLLANMPHLWKKFYLIINQWEHYFPKQILIIFKRLFSFLNWNVTEVLERLFEELMILIPSLINDMVHSSSLILSSMTYVIFVLFFIIITTYFFTKDEHLLRHLWTNFIPEGLRNYVYLLIYNIKRALLALFKTQIILALITIIIAFIGFSIFKIEHAFSLAIILLFIDLIPYLGIGLLFLPWILFMFFAKNYPLTIQLIIIFSFLTIIRQIVEPKLLAIELKLHPLATIIVLFFSLQFFGLLGFIYTPVLLILMSSLYHANVFHILLHYIKHG